MSSIKCCSEELSAVSLPSVCATNSCSILKTIKPIPSQLEEQDSYSSNSERTAAWRDDSKKINKQTNDHTQSHYLLNRHLACYHTEPVITSVILKLKEIAIAPQHSGNTWKLGHQRRIQVGMSNARSYLCRDSAATFTSPRSLPSLCRLRKVSNRSSLIDKSCHSTDLQFTILQQQPWSLQKVNILLNRFFQW